MRIVSCCAERTHDSTCTNARARTCVLTQSCRAGGSLLFEIPQVARVLGHGGQKLSALRIFRCECGISTLEMLPVGRPEQGARERGKNRGRSVPLLHRVGKSVAECWHLCSGLHPVCHGPHVLVHGKRTHLAHSQIRSAPVRQWRAPVTPVSCACACV